MAMRYLDDEARNLIEQKATGNNAPLEIACTQTELDEFNQYWMSNGFTPISDSLLKVKILIHG